MLPRRDTLNLEMVVPDNAVAVIVNPGASWAWSSWVQVTAGISSPLLLTHLIAQIMLNVVAAVSPTVFEPLHIQIGKGAAGSEEVIGELGFCCGMYVSATATVILGNAINLPLTPTIVPANTRLAVRATEQSATVYYQLVCYLYGYDATKFSLPLYFRQMREIEQLLKGLKTKLPRIVPLASLSAYITSGATWTWGSWVKIISSADKDILIVGVVHTPISSLTQYQIQIGIGAAGSEQAMSTVGCPGASLSGVGTYYLPRPLLVKKDERVSVRNKASGASRQSTVNLLYYELT